MRKSVRSKAEAQFSATQKKADLALKEKEKARVEKADHVAKLRALRLAKEAEEKVAAEEAEKAAEIEKAVPAKRKKPVRLPQTHRSPS